MASTGTVEVADNMAKSHGVGGLGRAVAIMGASLFAYGVVWIVKFVIFNRLVFASPSVAAPPPASETVTATAGRAATAAPAGEPAPVTPVTPVAARPVEPAWEGPARAGR